MIQNKNTSFYSYDSIINSFFYETKKKKYKTLENMSIIIFIHMDSKIIVLNDRTTENALTLFTSVQVIFS